MALPFRQPEVDASVDPSKAKTKPLDSIDPQSMRELVIQVNELADYKRRIEEVLNTTVERSRALEERLNSTLQASAKKDEEIARLKQMLLGRKDIESSAGSTTSPSLLKPAAIVTQKSPKPVEKNDDVPDKERRAFLKNVATAVGVLAAGAGGLFVGETSAKANTDAKIDEAQAKAAEAQAGREEAEKRAEEAEAALEAEKKSNEVEEPGAEGEGNPVQEESNTNPPPTEENNTDEEPENEDLAPIDDTDEEKLPSEVSQSILGVNFDSEAGKKITIDSEYFKYLQRLSGPLEAVSEEEKAQIDVKVETTKNTSRIIFSRLETTTANDAFVRVVLKTNSKEGTEEGLLMWLKELFPETNVENLFLTVSSDSPTVNVGEDGFEQVICNYSVTQKSVEKAAGMFIFTTVSFGNTRERESIGEYLRSYEIDKENLLQSQKGLSKWNTEDELALELHIPFPEDANQLVLEFGE